MNTNKKIIYPSPINNKNMDRYLHQKLAEAAEGGGGGSDSVKYTEQELTSEQQAQARTNIGATTPEIFWAEYGVTTYADVVQAYSDGKAVLISRNNAVYLLTNLDSSYAHFGTPYMSNTKWVRVSNSDVWSQGLASMETLSNKSQSVLNDRANTTKYPSVKAVADALGKWGVVSQTQTWTGDNNTGYDYTMSNLVYGLIPQANIDLYEAAGAVFNPTTGYFELNGLTDISYQEMKGIYTQTLDFVIHRKDRDGNFSYCKARTLIPPARATDTITVSYVWAFCNATFEVIPELDRVSSLSNGFRASPKLKEVLGVMDVSGMSAASGFSNCFLNNFSLESIKPKGLKYTITLSPCSRLTLASVVYMVENAANTSAITITLHATAYARCQADTTEYTYQGNTYTGILAYASAKNITIASA